MLEQFIIENTDVFAFLGKYAILIIVSTIAWIVAVFQFTESSGLVSLDVRKILQVRAISLILLLAWTCIYLYLTKRSDYLLLDSKAWNLLVFGSYSIFTILTFIFFTISLVNIYIDFKKSNNLLTQLSFLIILGLPLVICKFYFLAATQLSSIQ